MAHGFKTGGRRKGVGNRATRRAREVLTEVIEHNAERVQDWLDGIEEKEGPKEALRAYTALIEFAIPKMQRNELSASGTPTQIHVSWGAVQEPSKPTTELPNGGDGSEAKCSTD